MDWKVDWLKTDNYSEPDTANIERLLSNYNGLKTLLNTEFGFNIVFTTPGTNGYQTVAASSFFNSIEYCMNALHVWTVRWIEKTVTWLGNGQYPDYEDINRWEWNGREIEAYAKHLLDYYNELIGGAFYGGTDRVTQIFSRGR